jgi:hypothetical protein
MVELDWHRTGHGSQLWLIDLGTGERKVWGGGDWAEVDDEA